MADVRTEISASGQISLNDANVRSLFGIASGQISLNDGHGKAWVTLSNYSVNSILISPSTAIAFYQLAPDGYAKYNDNGGDGFQNVGSNNWAPGTSTPGSFECRATMTSGSLTSGTTGTWMSLSSASTWYIVRSSVGNNSCSFTVEIRLASSGAVLASASINLSATVEPGR